MAGGLGGHRVIDNSIPAGKLKQDAIAQVINAVALIFPLEVENVTVVSGQTSFTVTVSTGPSSGLKDYGIVVASNSFELVKEYGNVILLNEFDEEMTVWGRVTMASGSSGSYTYTVTTYQGNKGVENPSIATLPGSSIATVVLPLRKQLSNVSQTELTNARLISGGTATSEEVNDLLTRVAQIEAQGVELYNETPTGVVSLGNHAFSLTHSPIAGSTQLIAYGLCLTPGVHYNISGSTLTYVDGFEPASGDTHRISYRY
jgi:hypothetical protein